MNDKERRATGEAVNEIMARIAQMVTSYGDLRVAHHRIDSPETADSVNRAAESISTTLREARDAWRGCLGLAPFVPMGSRAELAPPGTTIH
jgi:hypothetical protein